MFEDCGNCIAMEQSGHIIKRESNGAILEYLKMGKEWRKQEVRQRTGDLDRKRIIEILLPPVIAFLVNSAVYWGAPRLTDTSEYHNLSLALDTKIPLIPAFILVYFGCYIFWVINYLLVSLREEEIKYRFFTADLYARIICFLFFVFYPTTNVRPELVGNGIFVQGMHFLYQIDEPVNLFPSIHCMASWFCCIGIRGDKKVPVWYKIVSVMIAVLVFISTLVTKQHVIVDVIGGVAVAELTWFVSCRTNGWKIYRNLVRKAGGENGK